VASVSTPRSSITIYLALVVRWKTSNSPDSRMATGTISSPNIPYFIDPPHLNGHHQVPVKTEASSSPDLSPGPPSLQHFQFKFNPPTAIHSHGSVPQSRNPSESPSCVPPQAIYRFGQDQTRYRYSVVSDQPWPSAISHHLRQDLNLSQRHTNRHIYNNSDYFRPTAMSYSDDYDNGSDLADIVDVGHGFGDSAGGHSHDKAVRRRSSKGGRFSLFHPCS